MNVLRFELADGNIVYSRQAEPSAIRELMGITQGADKMTVMEMPEHEYFALPLMPEELSNRGLVSRWEVRVSDG